MRRRELARRAAADLRAGRHLEAYSIFGLSLALTVLGMVGDVPQPILLSGVLLGVSFLVLRTTVEREHGTSDLEQVLRGRDALGAFSDMLPDGGEVWVYGPSAVNVLVNAGAFRSKVLSRGGRVRVIVQDPASDAVAFTKAQLDGDVDFDHALASSLSTLRNMRGWGDCEFRLAPFSPGFSMVVVNPTRPDGFLVLELHGYGNDTIGDRMHLRISRAASLRWFDYWTGRFEQMWQQAREDISAPTAAP